MTHSAGTERAPFGSQGRSIGSQVGDLLNYLSEEETRTDWDWDLHDAWALEYWSGLETAVHQLDSRVSGIQRVHDSWHDFQVAAPFKEAERRWLFEVYRQPQHGIAEFYEAITNQTQRIVVEGIRRVVDGRELMERWLAWRQQSGEYEGQGTLCLAREDLSMVIGLVAPGQALPRSYAALPSSEPPLPPHYETT